MGIGLISSLGLTCCVSCRLHQACPDEARTPSYIMGTVVGIYSAVGFLPDVLIYPIIGCQQSTLPTAEVHHNIWLMGMAALGMVIIFTSLSFRKIHTADNAPAVASNR